MSQARVITHNLKLHASPAMGEGPCICDLPFDSLVEVTGEDVGDRDDPVCLPVMSEMSAQPGYVAAAHIRFIG